MSDTGDHLSTSDRSETELMEEGLEELDEVAGSEEGSNGG